MTTPLASGDVFALCGQEHTACLKKKGGTGPEYKMFSAAAEGCLRCVRYYVEREKIPHDITSESGQYTALDFAAWSTLQDGVDTTEVQRYLKQQSAHETGGVNTAQGLVPAAFSDYTGSCNPRRRVFDRRSSTDEAVKMFHGAAYDGCKDCTKFWVEHRHLSPLVTSGGYSAVGWARYGAQQAVGDRNLRKVGLCSEIAGCLETVAEDRRSPALPHGEARRLHERGTHAGQTVAASSSQPDRTPPLPNFQAVPPPPPPVEQEPTPRPFRDAAGQSRAPGDTAGLGNRQDTVRGRRREARRSAR